MKEFSTQPRRLMLALLFSLLAGCGGSSASAAPLSAQNLNLIFVTSPDLAYHAPGDVQADTANLSPQGLQRSLLMATYLKQHLMGGNNVNGIHALTPTTHLQTVHQYPDMAGIGFIQQFALLNQFTLPDSASGVTFTANSFPVHVAYTAGSVPAGVPLPKSYCPDCSGLDFNDTKGRNAALLAGIIRARSSGYYVFSAPWETIRSLLAGIKTLNGYRFDIPTVYAGPNVVYAITLNAERDALLLTLDSRLNPPASYPVLPAPVASAACTHQQQSDFSTTRTGGVGGALVPVDTNTKQRLYIVRHAEAHPDSGFHFENGNFVGAGQWRALNLATALRGKISPDQVVSIDPAQWFPKDGANYSYVRPALTVLPYVIANNLPYSLVTGISIAGSPVDSIVARDTANYFFTGGKFSNQTVLLAWESGHIRPFINALLASYGGANLPSLPTAGSPLGGWPSDDYDTVWRISLDAQGNLTVDNALCEGIDSSKLPVTAPQF
jgi:hypothetical protein